MPRLSQTFAPLREADIARTALAQAETSTGRERRFSFATSGDGHRQRGFARLDHVKLLA